MFHISRHFFNMAASSLIFYINFEYNPLFYIFFILGIPPPPNISNCLTAISVQKSKLSFYFHSRGRTEKIAQRLKYT